MCVRECLIRLVWLAPALLVGGCRGPQPTCTDCYLADVCYPIDTAAPSQPFPGPADRPGTEPPGAPEATPGQRAPSAIEQRPGEPFRLPADLPGADAPPIHLPPPAPDQPDAERRRRIEQLYSRLPELSQPGPWEEISAGPLTLASLQMMAWENSPIIRQAAADVEAARGAAIQAGTYPNPNAGYEADTVNTANTNGYHGAYFQQTIITAGKLRLAQMAAATQVDSALLNLRKARIEVASRVRAFYFAAIVAREKLKLAKALASFTERLYQAQIELVQGGEAAPYEPLQLRVLALQARASVAQSQQEYLSAWRQLAAALGMPGLPPTQLAGRPDAPVPKLEYERALAYMLANHTDFGVAQNQVTQASFLLRLAEVTPIPDVDVGVVVQRDHTFTPGTTTYNLTLGGEVPVFNRNRGNIVTAQASLYQAEQAIAQVRNELTGRLGEAFARYEANRVLAETFRAEALRDQVRTYRGVYERYRNDPQGIGFSDVVVAQQTLAITLNQYIDVLGNEWKAVVDVAELLQIDDLFVMGEMIQVAPIPDLDAAEPEPIPKP